MKGRDLVKVTIKCLLYNMNTDCEKTIDSMMLQFCSAKRYAYSRIVANIGNKDFKPQHLDGVVAKKYNLNIPDAPHS